MRNWRVLTAIAAVVLAALAAVLVWKYTDNARQDAKKPFQLVNVIVAKARVPSGTTFDTALSSDLIGRAQRVKHDLPDNYVQDASDASLRTTFKNLVAAHDIDPGLPIVQTDFVAQSQLSSSTGLAGQLANHRGAEAITVTFNDTQAVGGFLNPGDHVNVLASLDVGDPAHPNSSKTYHTTAFLLSNLTVMAVGSATSTSTGASAVGATPTTAAPQNRGLITFRVDDPRQAEQLVQAQSLGQLYLTLLPPNFKVGDFQNPTEVVKWFNLFDQSLTKVIQVANTSS